MAVVKAIFSFLWTLASGLVKGVLDVVRPKQELPPPRPAAAPAPKAEAKPQPVSAPPVKAAAPAAAPAAPAASPFNILSEEKPKPAAAPAAPAAKGGKTILQPAIVVEKEAAAPSDEIRIKAQPSKSGDACKFMVDRPVFAGHSWHYGNRASAEGSPLAEALFAIEDVETVVLLDSTVTVTRRNKQNRNWQPLAKEVGAAIREHLKTGKPAVSEKILAGMPDEEDIRRSIQRIIEMEVNPGVAAHGGVITLTHIVGNTVTISMGGGCQGCSAADITLKEGIHNSFRKAQPYVGAILDETNHAAGENPYFS